MILILYKVKERAIDPFLIMVKMHLAFIYGALLCLSLLATPRILAKTFERAYLIPGMPRDRAY